MEARRALRRAWASRWRFSVTSPAITMAAVTGPVTAADGHDAAFPVGAVVRRILELPGGALAEHLFQRLAEPLAKIPRHQGQGTAAHGPLRRQRRDGAVHQQDLALGVHRHDDVGRMLEQVAQLGLGFAQRLVRQLALGDILHETHQAVDPTVRVAYRKSPCPHPAQHPVDTSNPVDISVSVPSRAGALQGLGQHRPVFGMGRVQQRWTFAVIGGAQDLSVGGTQVEQLATVAPVAQNASSTVSVICRNSSSRSTSCCSMAERCGCSPESSPDRRTAAR